MILKLKDCILDVDIERTRAFYERSDVPYVSRQCNCVNCQNFRMDKHGNRVADCNFCPSSNEAMELAAERAAEVARSLYRSSERFYFWMDDAKNKKCHCPKCRNKSASDQQLMVLERILSALRKERPESKLAYLAYFDTMELPNLEIADGLFLEYAPIGKTINAASAEAEEEIRMARLLRERFGCKDAKVLEYWLDNSLFSRWKKPPLSFSFTPESVKTMEDDIRNYVDMGFEVITTFACFLGTDYEELYGEADITPFARAIGKI